MRYRLYGICPARSMHKFALLDTTLQVVPVDLVRYYRCLFVRTTNQLHLQLVYKAACRRQRVIGDFQQIGRWFWCHQYILETTRGQLLSLVELLIIQGEGQMSLRPPEPADSCQWGSSESIEVMDLYHSEAFLLVHDVVQSQRLFWSRRKQLQHRYHSLIIKTSYV